MKYKNLIKKHKKYKSSNAVRLAVHIGILCLSSIVIALSITFLIFIKKPILRLASLITFLVAGFGLCLNAIIYFFGNCIKQKEQSDIIKEARKLLKDHEINSDRRNKLTEEFDRVGVMIRTNEMKLRDELHVMTEQANKYIQICDTSENQVEISYASKEIENLTKQIERKVEEINQLHSVVVSHTDNITESIESERHENDLVIKDEEIAINESRPIKSTWGTDNPHALFKANKQRNYGAINDAVKNVDPTITPTNQRSSCALI
jgi:hypothetical protein